MAISTDQMTMELKKIKTGVANQDLAFEQFSDPINHQRLISALQTTINLDELLPIFSAELSNTVTHSGFTFEHSEIGVNIQHGQRTNHTCEYTLAIENTSLGKMKFMRRQRFNEDELKLIENHLSALLYPLKNTLLYLQAIQSAHTDPLTGVLNRSTLQSLFQKETALIKRYPADLTLLMLDIDFFKKVNDTYGHAMGDKALIALTQCITETARESDHIFRLGGEEFAILLSSTDLEGANLLAERLRKAVQNIDIQQDEKSFNFTVSIGLTHHQANDTLETIMQRADKALYQAKETGRNKVVSA
ncbi:MAG: GGDEF domain-containing protein [Cycloclasticus sp.]|nr:GGDEF domain-containing protein [Cycloclasticus sp.]